MSNKKVINRLGDGALVIFIILFGFVISEHLRNISELILNLDINKLPLSIILFVYFLIMFLEAILYFESYEKNIPTNEVMKNIFLYLIWAFQFIPMYTMSNALNKSNINFLSTISYSFICIYIIYILYVATECFFLKKEKSIKHKIKTIILYMIFCLVFVGYTKFKLNLVYNSIGLTILICIKTFFYIIYWKDFYKARLYTIQPYKSL